MAQSARTPYVFSLVSITLVLFFLGFFGLLAISGKYIVDITKEELELKALLVEGTTPDQAKLLLNDLREKPYVKTIRYRSREEIFEDFNDLGNDFKEAMQGYNPFLSSINIQLNAPYIQSDSVRALGRALLAHPEITEVDYPISLIETVDYRSGWILRGAAVVAGLLGFLAYIMILNTVKLAIFSRRLIIRSMQLIGATASYVRWPIVRLGLLQGGLGGLIAAAMLAGLLFLLQTQLKAVDFDIVGLATSTPTLALYGGLVLFGAALGYLSSRVAISRYLNKSLDEIA